MDELKDARHFLDYWRVLRSRKETVIAVALMIIIAGLLITISLPKRYAAHTRITVTRVTADVAVFRADQGDSWYNPFYLKTQIEVIQSQRVLNKVINDLGLCQKFAAARKVPNLSVAHTRRELLGNMRVTSFLDTNIIKVEVSRDSPVETVRADVKEIADAIADVYQEVSTADSRAKTKRGVAALNDAYSRYVTDVEEKEAEVEELRSKLNITRMTEFSREGDSLSKIRLQALESSRVLARKNVLVSKVRLAKLKTLGDDERLYALSYLLGDPALAKLRREMIDARLKLTQLQQSLGPKHPEVVQLTAVMTGLEQEVKESMHGASVALETDNEIAQRNFEAIESELQQERLLEIERAGGQYLPFRNAEAELLQLRALRDTLKMRWIEEGIAENLPQTPVKVIDWAVAPGAAEHVAPKFFLNLVLSIVVGLACGVGLAFFAEYIDTSIKTIEDIEDYIGVPVIGVVPAKVKPLVNAGRRSPHAEAYRVLRTNMQFSKKLGGGKTICITSGGSGEGKSFTVSNLAFVCAQLGYKVLVIDADLRRPAQHKTFELPRKPGLSDVLRKEVSFEDAVQNAGMENLFLLTSGRSTVASAGLLDTPRMRDLIAELKEKYDYVILDAPPIIGVSDASVLVSQVDAALLVIQPRSYPKVLSHRASNIIENVGGNLVGVVLNNINISRDYYYYYHSYPGKYAYGQPQDAYLSTVGDDLAADDVDTERMEES